VAAVPLIRKHKAGSCPGHTWDSDGAVVEVDDALAVELLAIPDGGFSEVAPSAQLSAPDGSADGPEVVEAPPAPRRGRPRKATDSEVSE
jgi:hypothetical protein